MDPLHRLGLPSQRISIVKCRRGIPTAVIHLPDRSTKSWVQRMLNDRGTPEAALKSPVCHEGPARHYVFMEVRSATPLTCGFVGLLVNPFLNSQLTYVPSHKSFHGALI